MSTTTNPKNPLLQRGVDDGPTEQAPVYLLFSEAERDKGFVRPLRSTYKHVGIHPEYPLRDLTPEEKQTTMGELYVAFEKYPEERSPATGRFWTKAELNFKCDGVTTIQSKEITETYARSPQFYGSTYCIPCQRHVPVKECVWVDDGSRVGS